MSEQPRIIFVDDDPRAGELFLRFIAEKPFDCRVFRRAEEALAYFQAEGADAVVSDIRMPGMDGIALLEAVRKLSQDVPFILITAHSSVNSAIDALRLGATDFVKKPYDADELLLQLQRVFDTQQLRSENRLLRRQLDDSGRRFGMIGSGAAMRQLFAIIDKIADIRCNVVIQGESGTGKELAARAIHFQGQYRSRPFMVIDCGTLSDSLLESELFGHERGAFTGATQQKAGLLEVADGGTVFLDEIGNISTAMQSRLLRVIQEQELTRVGGVAKIGIDVRFIAATNRDLEAMVTEGTFRHDLYHRLNVVKLAIPALRDHREDIPALVQGFVDEFGAKFHREVRGFDAESMDRLMAHDWSGNVRELRNVVERHIALAGGPELHLEELGVAGGRTAIDADEPTLAELERRYILQMLKRSGGSRETTAAKLGINKSTLWRKLRQFGEVAED